eukprot:scaffold3296_cov280-Alexandrium_tamarense.AAC.5
MILCYCHENVNEGLSLLRHGACNGHLRSLYALSLILRDSRYEEANYYINVAADSGYKPAWQEKLTASEMRARFGDMDADALRQYLDPPCLNRLLSRHYVQCKRVRKNQTSHCWNPMCGRWGYKAMSSTERRQQRAERGGSESNREEEGKQIVHKCHARVFSIQSLLPQPSTEQALVGKDASPLETMRQILQTQCRIEEHGLKVARMKMCIVEQSIVANFVRSTIGDQGGTRMSVNTFEMLPGYRSDHDSRLNGRRQKRY